MTNTDATPQTPDPNRSPATSEPGPAGRSHRIPDAVVLVALLATCAGTWRARR